MKDFDHVYEPSDDTYLLLDGLQLAMNEQCLPVVKEKMTTLELGCGTGVVTVFLAMELQRESETSRHDKDNRHHVVTDINPEALRATQETARANRVEESIRSVQCDLASQLLPELAESVDVLVFNPPYVPTPDDEVGGNGIEASWAGGVHGRRVIDRAIPQIAQLLKKPHGTAYIITVDDNLPEDMASAFEQLGWKMEPWVRRRARNEFLTVQRVTQLQNQQKQKV